MTHRENHSTSAGSTIPDIVNLVKVEPLFDEAISISLPPIATPHQDSKKRKEIYSINGEIKGKQSRAFVSLYDTGEVDMSVIGRWEWGNNALIGVGVTTTTAGESESNLLLAPLSFESLGEEFLMCVLDIGKNIEKVEIRLPLHPYPQELFTLYPTEMAEVVANSIRKGHLRGKGHDYEINNNFKGWAFYKNAGGKRLPQPILQAIDDTLNELGVSL